MKPNLTIMTASLFLCIQAFAIAPESFVFSELPKSGVKVVQGYKGTPSQGVLAEYQIQLPPFERACYFSSDNQWYSAGNRVLPWMMGSDLTIISPANAVGKKMGKHPSPDGLFALFQLTSGEVLALLPLAGSETACWLNLNASGGLQLNLGTLGTAPVNADVPLLAWARAPDASAACREIWRLVTTGELTKDRTTNGR